MVGGGGDISSTLLLSFNLFSSASYFLTGTLISYREKAQKDMYIVGDSFCQTYIRVISPSMQRIFKPSNVVECGTPCDVKGKKKKGRKGKGKRKKKNGRHEVSWML